MKSTIRTGVLAGVLTTVLAPSALAAPVTVDLRVEGPTSTLVEQKVTVDVRPFKFTDSAQTYQCDNTTSGSGNTVPAPTRGGALSEAAEKSGFELTGTFNTTFNSPSFQRINGTQIPPFAQENKYLAEFKNAVSQNFGSCGDSIVDGDNVVYAYSNGSEPLLKLTGPATVAPGQAATLTVTDEGTKAAVSGAAAGGKSSGADGRLVTAPLTQRGPNLFKATKTGTIRSNAVSVCVTDGADGFCGTTKPGSPPPPPGSDPATPPAVGPLFGSDPATPPAAGPLFGGDDKSAFAKIMSIKEGQTFKVGQAPRELKGTVDEDLVGVDDVRLRIGRKDGGRCFKYVGSSDREEFVRTRKCSIKSSRTFSVAKDRSWEYLLPEGLEKGRYVLDVIVKDRTGNQTKTYQRGRNRVVFYVK